MQIQIVRFALVLFLVSGLAGTASAATVVLEEPGTTEANATNEQAIVQKWKLRQDRTKSGRFVTTINRPANGIDQYQVEFLPPGGSTSSEIKQSLQFLEESYRFDSLRWHQQASLEFAGYQTDDSFDEYLQAARPRLTGGLDSQAPLYTRRPYDYTAILSGKVYTEIFTGRTEESPHIFLKPRQGTGIESGLDSLLFRPVMLAYRPMSFVNRDEPLKSLSVVDKNSAINSDICIVVECRPNEKTTHRLWLDPSRDLAVLRDIEIHEGHHVSQLDIEYAKETDAGWVPKRWTTMVFNHELTYPGRPSLFQSVAVNVVDYAINPPLASALFLMPILRGAVVKDEMRQKMFRITDNASFEPLQANDAVQSAAKAVAAKAPFEMPEYLWNVVAGILIVVAAACFIVIRRRIIRRRAMAGNAAIENTTTPDGG